MGNDSFIENSAAIKLSLVWDGSWPVVQASESDRTSRRRRIAIREEDLEELYLLVQGAPYANTVIDAQVSLSQKDYATSLQLIESARERFRQSHSRTLRQDVTPDEDATEQEKKQARRDKQRQDRCKSVLAAFDDVIDILGRMIKLRVGTSGSSREESGEHATVATLLQPGSAFRNEYETAHSTRVQLATLRRYFDVQCVSGLSDIQCDELYFVRSKEQVYLVCVTESDGEQEQVSIRVALSGQRMRPIPLSKFLEMGKRQSLVRLVPKGSEPTSDAEGAAKILEDLSADAGSESHGNEVLDTGSFSQLLDAALRSGLVANADLIAQVRDSEFRRKNYQKAFQILEVLYGKFSAAATQRDQKLRRENVDIASGKVRMSPKQLMEKRARDIAETQLVDRARIRFMRVLEGLRVLMRS